MAEQSAQDEIKQPQSMGASALIDVPAANFTSDIDGGEGEQESSKEGAFNLKTSDLSVWSSSTTANEHAMLANGVAPQPAFSLESSVPNDESREEVFGNVLSAIAPEDQLVNGEYGHENNFEDTRYQPSLGVDTGGSDTDTSKTESLDHSKEDTLKHVRSNSMKKPTSFKAVSVTKNFLAKSGAGIVAVSKSTNDKVSPAGQAGSMSQPAVRPRLVAKFGRDARSSIAGPGTNNGAPDASKVWNKNRPVLQPSQKQMTDEELKQHYGIHLATRIQADEASKDSKWADIDDDEADWAPETVEWIDGTKSTVLSADDQSIGTHKLPDPSSGQSDKSVEASKAAPSMSQRPVSAGIGKTILRPGAHTTPQKPGLILKSVPENVPAPPKSTTPNASKSPWAPLPPVDISSPVLISPPSQISLQQANFTRRETHALDTDGPVQSPAKEIAPDDYDRSWRDSDRGNRELFNSQSGRYEPVPARDRRRPSIRNEGGFRQPSLLQRPAHQTANAPAEPSNAFQTRRRNSSSVSDRNVGFINQQFPNRPEASPTENVTVTESSLGAARQAMPVQSPTLQQRYAAQPPGGKRNQPPPNETSTESFEALQMRLMREKIELNRKRKKEEEEKEEAAKRERIRLKLEALGPEPAKSPGEETNTDPSKNESQHEAIAPPQIASAQPPTIKSPTSSISIAQSQILQKISQSPSAERTIPTTTALEPQRSASLKSSNPLSDPLASVQPHSVTSRPQNRTPLPPPRARSEDDLPNQLQADVDRMTNTSLDQPFGLSTQSWKPIPSRPDPSTGWVNSGIAAHTVARNVWGPPTNDRTLGNGVFERDFPSVPAIHLSQQKQPHELGHTPGPIGPPSPSPRIPFETSRIVSTPSPSEDHLRSTVSPIGPFRYDSTSASNNRSISQADHTSAMGRPYLTSTGDNFYRQPPQDMAAAKSAWQNLPSRLAKDEAAKREIMKRDYDARMVEEQRTGGTQSHEPNYSASFRSTAPSDEDAARQKMPSIADPNYPGQSRTMPPRESFGPLGQSYADFPVGNYGLPNARGSRFFGQIADREPMQTLHGGLATGSLHFEDEFAPPPDGDEHPVYSSGSYHPTVRLPAHPTQTVEALESVKPEKPTVKLPPAQQTTTKFHEPPASAGRNGSSFRAGAQPIISQIAWQDRFNGLFNKKPLVVPTAVTPKMQAVVVASASRVPLDESPAKSTLATVALPNGVESLKALPSSSDDCNTTDSKPADHVLFDEPEFGSSPTISLPKLALVDAHYASLPPPSQASTAQPGAPAILSRNKIDFIALESEKSTTAGLHITIHIPGNQLKTAFLAKKRHMMDDGKGPRKPYAKRRLSTGRSASGGRNSYLDTRDQKLSPNRALDSEARSNGWKISPKGPKHGLQHQSSGNSASSGTSKASPRQLNANTSKAALNLKDEDSVPPSAKVAQPKGTEALLVQSDTPRMSRSGWAKPHRGKTGGLTHKPYI